ncbi:hypothetical protein GYMLUDRAFT_241187 [Collybiopsis luxurians FD-317 M1]|uniref:Ubinuclein middle domain-containing protein n=1 Tax=Collybiopsis luxurians FD-317 M1 TaxID=944289 RepID=A0A0D0CLS3_9AGAR|nr:hypothetical protein GYMLUDRAFT_241187 [Collybiopsis luxurians FD-317 M1]
MGSASAAPSPNTNVLSDHDQDVNNGPSHSLRNGTTPNGREDSPPSPGAESASTGAASSEDEDEEDDEEGGEEHERVDENGAIVIEDDDEDDGEDSGDDAKGPPTTVKSEPLPDSNSLAISALLNGAESEKKPASKPADKTETPLPPPTSTASAKPKSKQKVKARSPSPLPLAPPPLQTVRLSIPLGGPENYAVDISALAKATGQRPPTPVQKKHDESSDSEAEKTKAAESEQPKKKKKKKNAASEYYDVTDPFIDDSELAVDDRKFFAQTKQQGFYVSSGEVALMKDRSPTKKPKSKRFTNVGNAEAGPSSQHPRHSVEGSKDAPIALDDESDNTRPPVSQSFENGHANRKKKNWLPTGAPGAKSRSPSATNYGTGLNAPLTGNLAAMRKLNWMDPEPDPGDFESEGYGDGGEKLGMKRKRVTYSTVMENGKKRKVVDITSFHPELQASLEHLKEAIKAESWEQKGKFPPSIKPVLAQVAVKAITLDQYDEHFFNLMPTLFPYNKFTMSKLIKRTIFADHIKLLVERQDALLAELKRQADEGFPKAEEEWEKSVVAWDQRQKRLKADTRGEDSGSNGGPTRHPTEDPEAHADGLDEDNYPVTTSHPPLMGGAGGSGLAAQVAAEKAEKAEKTGKADKDKDAQPPPKKYRLTENMKAIVWELVLLSNECCRLENEKNTLEGSVMQVSEQGLRKVLYQKIVSAFPLGWMSSGQISRDVSAMKKRLEKEREEEQEMDNAAAS